MQRSSDPQRDTGVTNEDIYNDVSPRLMRFATALVGPTEAEDVVSAVITKALTRRGGLVALDEPGPYLMKAVLNESNGLKRTRARRRTMAMASVPERASGGIDSTYEVRQVLDDLPSRQRAAAYLVFYEERTAVEAARILGVRPATVRRYLHLARERVERVLS